MKPTPTAIIFLDGVKTADIVRLQQLLQSEQSNKAVKNMTFALVGNSGLAETLMNPEIVKSLLTTAIRRQHKLASKKPKKPKKLLLRSKKK